MMTDADKEALSNKLVQFLVHEMPREAMANDKDFRECIQGMIYCLYIQLRENLGAQHGMMALGEVLQVASEECPGAGVHVELIPTPYAGGKH